jgi:hypothetical protein
MIGPEGFRFPRPDEPRLYRILHPNFGKFLFPEVE